jgi:hypothetical protein
MQMIFNAKCNGYDKKPCNLRKNNLIIYASNSFSQFTSHVRFASVLLVLTTSSWDWFKQESGWHSNDKWSVNMNEQTVVEKKRNSPPRGAGGAKKVRRFTLDEKLKAVRLRLAMLADLATPWGGAEFIVDAGDFSLRVGDGDDGVLVKRGLQAANFFQWRF